MQVEFGSLFQFIRNGMNVKQDKSGDGLPITRIETISDATVDANRVGYAGLSDEDCDGWLLERGDILFSHINSVEHVGKCAIYEGRPEKLVHGMNLLCLRCDQNKLLPEFAKYLIRGPAFRTRLSNFINKAVNQASVSIGNLKTIPVAIPPLPEQRRIAAILDQADSLRAKRREALAQLDSLTQSIFIEMFGDQRPSNVRDEGVPLSTMVEINPRITAQEREKLEGVEVTFLPMASIGDLDKRVLTIETRPYGEVAKGYTPFKVGDLLVAKITPCYENGKMAVVEGIPTEFGFGSTEFHVFRCNSRQLCLFVFHLLQLDWIAEAGANSMKGAAGQKRVPADFFGSLLVSLPDSEQLSTFASRISKINELKAKGRAAVAELDELFSSLQHRAFRGEL